MAMYKGTKLLGSGASKKTVTPAYSLASGGPRTTNMSQVGKKSMSSYGGDMFPKENTYTMANSRRVVAKKTPKVTQRQMPKKKK